MGRAVRERMRELSWTQSELYRRSGVSETTIARTLRNEPLTRADVQRKLAEALGWEPDAIQTILAGRRPKMRPPTADTVAQWTELRDQVERLGAEIERLWEVVNFLARELDAGEPGTQHPASSPRSRR